MLAHVDAGGHVHGGTLCATERIGQVTNGVGAQAYYAGHGIGAIGGNEGTQGLDAGAMLTDHALIETAQPVDLMEQGGHQVEIRVGKDLYHFPGFGAGGFDLAGVDVEDPGAALAGGTDFGHGVGDGNKAHV